MTTEASPPLSSHGSPGPACAQLGSGRDDRQIAGCGKSLPGLMMAMLRLNVPLVFMYGGSILPGRFKGKDVTIGDVFEGVGAHDVRQSLGRGAARFSGATHGFSVGHVGPEAAVGGPIGLLRDGNIVTIDTAAATLDSAEGGAVRAQDQLRDSGGHSQAAPRTPLASP